jgi:O-antigen/teichoic acid export membrane protein
MAELVKCKSCGFVMESGKLKDKCPACGVPSKMFEPYIDPVSEKRRMLLGFHIHPILVHFPQAFAFTLFVLSLTGLFLSGELKQNIIVTVIVMTVILPVVVLLSFLSGLFDGKTRFRKLNTPFLTRKIFIGSAFLLISIVMNVIIFTCPAPSCLVWYVIASAAAAGCSFPLGIIGTWLTEAKFNG